eukprot:scaffold8668_cov89-Skeletonema_dohrnii-CCMP3373.AAC.2
MPPKKAFVFFLLLIPMCIKSCRRLLLHLLDANAPSLEEVRKEVVLRLQSSAACNDDHNNMLTTMSADSMVAEAADMMMCCASCGKSELDDIKLMDCDACDLVKYCSDDCKEDHRWQHETNCKERVSELRDEKLFRQPESSHLGDCPICCLPLPLNHQKSLMQSCCSTTICRGCAYANKLRESEARLQFTCPFCRSPLPKTKEENNKKKMRRVAANDPVALSELGRKRYEERDYERAFEYLTKAAELGDAPAHHCLSIMYRRGLGVEKDEKKEVYNLEEAAIAGHPDARQNLGCYEWDNERYDRAVKHWIIAANLGHDTSIRKLKGCYKLGKVSKEDFAAALRAHQAAVDATKSPQRDAAEASEEFRAYQQQTFSGNT